MVVHTSQPLAQQTDNPLASPSKTAEVILPHIAAHLTSSPTTRFLIIDFAPRHIPTVLALREVLGRKKFKIAGLVVRDSTQTILRPETSSSHSSSQPDTDLSPLTRNPTTLLTLSEAADWTMAVKTSTDATEKLNLSSKVWRVLREADGWYNPGAEEKVDDQSNRISIATTTMDKCKAPVVRRPISVAKRPEGYELGKSNFSRPLVPISPPESIPASPDGSRLPPLPPGPPPSSAYYQAAPPPQSPSPPPPPPPPPPSGHIYSAAPASPEPTIGSTASGSSESSKWRELMSKFHKWSPTPTPTVGCESGEGSASGKLGRKLSAIFGPPQNPARGKPISSPFLETSSKPMSGLVNISQGASTPVQAPSPVTPAIPQPPSPHSPSITSSNVDAQVTGVHDEDDYESDDDMDEEERRVLGRFGSRRYRDEDDKARRLLGLP